MRATTTRPTLAWLCGLLLLAPCLGGCGDDEGAPPRSSDAAPAVGSPDGAGTGTRSAAALLAHLRTQVQSGAGYGTPAFDRDVASVAAALWDSEGTPEERRGAQVHQTLAVIAGEAGAWLASSANAREERQDEAFSFTIHDAWLRGSSEGPEAYAAWCEEEGVALVRQRQEELQKRFGGR